MEQVTFSGETCCHSSSVQLNDLGSRPCNKKRSMLEQLRLLDNLRHCCRRIESKPYSPFCQMPGQNWKCDPPSRTLKSQNPNPQLPRLTCLIFVLAPAACCSQPRWPWILIGAPLLAACNPLHTTDSRDFDIGLRRPYCHVFCRVMQAPPFYLLPNPHFQSASLEVSPLFGWRSPITCRSLEYSSNTLQGCGLGHGFCMHVFASCRF